MNFVCSLSKHVSKEKTIVLQNVSNRAPGPSKIGLAPGPGQMSRENLTECGPDGNCSGASFTEIRLTQGFPKWTVPHIEVRTALIRIRVFFFFFLILQFCVFVIFLFFGPIQKYTWHARVNRTRFVKQNVFSFFFFIIIYG